MNTHHLTHNANRLDKRRAGILLHPTSLPGSPGNGDLGRNAYWFVDFLQRSGVTVWQTLPLGPTHSDLSPYQSTSAYAGNPLLINLELLEQAGWLSSDGGAEVKEEDVCDYRRSRLCEARIGFIARPADEDRQAYQKFMQENSYWVEDYALFCTLKKLHNQSAWWEWPPEHRERQPQALQAIRQDMAKDMEQHLFEQFIFFQQWEKLKTYANEREIKLFGDLPIFVATDSVDVWSHRSNFLLDETGKPEVVAGVPPDYFSETGQLWGNPHYDWPYMQQTKFQWWVQRLKAQQKLFDMVRIDHFRGFEAYWEIPADAPNAMSGRWVKAPGEALFSVLQQEVGTLLLVAEDLGVITPEVTALREQFGIAGMKILQFAFEGGAINPYLPHHHKENCVVYTGTHDNDTTLGWFSSLPESCQQYVCEYLGQQQEMMPWALIRAAFASVANLAVTPMQDILALDGAHRMNKPGTLSGNWRWRFTWDQAPENLHEKLRRMVEIYGR